MLSTLWLLVVVEEEVATVVVVVVGDLDLELDFPYLLDLIVFRLVVEELE
jgi:hypothetical protein